jgi:dolichyl-phosphate-mannose-protein mannosyltransferase
MRRSERLFLTSILVAGAALRVWGLTFGLPYSDARPGETAIVTTVTRLLDAGFKSDLYRAAAADATRFLLMARGLSAIAGLATIWLVFRLSARLFDRLTALTAAFFLAVAFLHVRESHFGVITVPAIALIVAALVAFARVVEDPAHIRRWALAAGLSGLAAWMFYSGGLVLAPGGSGVATARGWAYHLTFSLWYGLGAPLMAAGLAGTGLLAITSWKKAVLILTFPVLYYLAVGRSQTASVRDIAPVVPFLCITAALVVVWIARQLARERLVAAFAGTIAIMISLPTLQRSIKSDLLSARTDTRVLAADWIAAHTSPNEKVGQIPPVLLYPEFGVTRPAHVVTFDVARKAFVSVSGMPGSPDWIIVPTSPLSAFTIGRDELANIEGGDYVRETTMPSTHGPENPDWFDQQDLFFMPFSRFSMRDRPGPDIQIFHRRR